METDTRDLINQLGSELAGIMEDASVVAATLPRVETPKLKQAIAELERAAQRSQALAAGMGALLPNANA